MVQASKQEGGTQKIGDQEKVESRSDQHIMLLELFPSDEMLETLMLDSVSQVVFDW